MRNRPIEKTYEWTLTSPPGALWPYLSDSARLNEALGQPRYALTETFDKNDIRRRYAETIEDGTRVKWEEPPFEWVAGGWWRWRRFHDEGPFQETGAILMLAPDKAGGTRVHYKLSAEPRGILGRVLALSGHLKLAAAGFEKLSRRIDSYCLKPRGEFFSNLAAERESKARVNLPKRSDVDGKILTQFAHWLAVAPHMDRRDLRSKRLARCLGTSEAEALRACLLAVKSGDAALRYRAICSACRAAGNEYDTLKSVPALMACPRCGSGYRRDFVSGVEVLFSIKKTDANGAYCASGPGLARHVVVQQNLGAMERRELVQTLPPGIYTARAMDGPVSEPFEVLAGAGFTVRVLNSSINISDLPGGGIIENHAKRAFTVSLETLGLSGDALAMPDLLAARAFRELMPLENLPDGDSAPLGHGVVLSVADSDGPPVKNHDAALIDSDDGCHSLAYSSVEAAVAASENLLTTYPDARFAMHYGPLTIASLGGSLVYVGPVLETAKRLAMAGYRGEVILSREMQVAVADAGLSVKGAAR